MTHASYITEYIANENYIAIKHSAYIDVSNLIMKRLCCVKLSGSVDSAFHSASRISMYLGVFPYSLKSGKLQASKFYFLWSSLLTLTVIGLQVLIFIDPPTEENQRFMAKFLTYLQLGSLSATLLIHLAWLHNSKEKLNTALILLNKVNNRLATAEMNVSLIAPFTGLLLITVLAGAGAFLKVEGRIKFILLYVAYYVTSIMIYAVALQLSGTLALTKHFFKELHIRLPKPRTVGHQTSIDLLIESHETIVTACEAVNQAYAPQLLLIILTSFVLVTGNSYSVLISDEVSEATITVFWVILFAHLAWHIISACDGTYTEAAEFDKLLYRLVLDDKSGELSQNMKVCMHFTNKRIVQFSACGFFNINYTTASSMVATACTYLVILIQMGGTKEYPSTIQE